MNTKDLQLNSITHGKVSLEEAVKCIVDYISADTKAKYEIPNVNLCPNCGTKFDKVVVDPFADGCVKLLNDLKEERSEVPNKIKGNEQLLNSAIEKVDNTIKDIENTLEAWKRGEEDNNLFYEVEKIQRRFKVE